MLYILGLYFHLVVQSGALLCYTQTMAQLEITRKSMELYIGVIFTVFWESTTV